MTSKTRRGGEERPLDRQSRRLAWLVGYRRVCFTLRCGTAIVNRLRVDLSLDETFFDHRTSSRRPHCPPDKPIAL